MTFYLSIQTLFSVLSWSTYGSDYSLDSSWVWRYKLGTPLFGEFLPFFSADPLKLCQVGWGGSLHSYCQVYRDVRSAGPLKDIQRHVPKPLLHCLGCVLRVIVLLESEPLPQSEVLSTLEQVFIKDLSVLYSMFPTMLTCLPVPAAEKHPHSMMLPPCFTVWDCICQVMSSAWFPPDVTLGIQAKDFNLVSHGQSTLGSFWQAPSGMSCL